jgi:DNA helicase-2/ATP-dependent DNA helicase PcrA
MPISEFPIEYELPHAQATARVRAFDSAAVLRLSDVPSDKPLSLQTNPILLWDDSPAGSAIPRAQLSQAVRQRLFPAWQAGLPVGFLTTRPRSAFQPQALDTQWMHSQYSEILQQLEVEQLPFLLQNPPVQPFTPKRAPIHSLEKLDEVQTRAAQHVNGAMLVLAPAGSGKTRTLVTRILNLYNQGVPPERLLALAFNRKAREEMQQRLQAMGIGQVQIRTFHSLGYQIIRDTLGWQYAEAQERTTQHRILREALEKNVKLPRGAFKSVFEQAEVALQRVKEELLNPAEIRILYGEERVEFAPIWEHFLKLQAQAHHVGFSDMVFIACRLLLRQPELRKQWQSRFDFCMVDEFQDLNRAQTLLMQLMAHPQSNLFVVGDDDQLIYGWRGAEVGSVNEFKQVYPTHQQLVLAVNYRSSQAVIRHTRWLIDHNLLRVQKEIRPRTQAPAGELELALLPSLMEQARAIARWVSRILQSASQNEKAYTLQDFAVLFRYHIGQFPVARALDECNLAHTPIDERRLFQTEVGHDLHAYLQLILYPEKATDKQIQRTLKRPNRYLRSEVMRQITSWRQFKHAFSQSNLRSFEADALRELRASLLLLQNLAKAPDTTALNLLEWLDEQVELRRWYESDSSNASISPITSTELASDEVYFDTILAIAENYRTPAEFLAYVEQMMLETVTPEMQATPQHAVLLSTIHQSKGKEFTNVAVFHISEDNSIAHAVETVEEERRVLYVACTRAKDYLLVTAQQGKHSPFLPELLLNPQWQGLGLTTLAEQAKLCELTLARHMAEQERLQANIAKAKGDFPAVFVTDKPATLAEPLAMLAQRNVARWEQSIANLQSKEIPPLHQKLTELRQEMNLRNLLNPPKKET